MRVLALGRIGAAGADSPAGARGAIEPARYSRYKYGAPSAIERFAADLAALAMAELPAIRVEPATVTAPASRAVPIGADLLADGVLRAISRDRAVRRFDPPVRAKLHRYHVPAADYGTQGRAEREDLLAAERISGIPELFADRHVVVVDDLWVTGTSARVTAGAILRWRPKSLTYLVIGTVEPDFAARHPQIEAELNHAAVDGLPALAELAGDEPLAVNQRMCKFVLNHRPDEVRQWLDAVPSELAWRLHSAALAEGFGLMPAFRDSVAVLAAHVDERRLDECAAEAGWTPVP